MKNHKFKFSLLVLCMIAGGAIAQKHDKQTNMTRPVQSGVQRVLNQAIQKEDEVWLNNPYFKAQFTKNGFGISPRNSGLIWKWELENLNGKKSKDEHPILVDTKDSKYVDYKRGSITERYLFKNDNIEQVFILNEMPADKQVRIAGSITTAAKFESKKDHWTWSTEKGSVKLGALFVYDADGNDIASTFAVNENSTEIYIDEMALSKARFPVTIDPEIGPNDFRISDMGTNGDASNDASQAAIAYNSRDNTYLVVWRGDDNTGSMVDNEFEIFGQLLSADGTEIGPNDFRISDAGPEGNPSFFTQKPRVAYNATDNQFLVVWQGEDNVNGLVDGETEIFGQLISALGTEIGPNDFQISDMGTAGNTNLDANTPDIAYNSSANNYMVVWYGEDNVNGLVDNEFEIFGQIINAAGAEIGPNDFPISDNAQAGSTILANSDPSIAYNSTDNNFLVVWVGEKNTNGLVNNEQEVFGQIIDAAGSEIGPNDFRISDMGPDGDPNFDASLVRLAFNSINNNFLVIWSGDDNEGGMVDGENEIFGQLISNTGVEIGANDFRISNLGGSGNANFDALFPAVVYNSLENTYLIVWRGDDDREGLVDGEFEIFGQFLRDSGQDFESNDFRISDMGPNGDLNFGAFSPGLAYNSLENNFLAVWDGDDNTDGLVDGEVEIFAQLLRQSNPFTTSWQVSAGETIEIPLSNVGTYDFNYCWKQEGGTIELCGNHTSEDGPFTTTFTNAGVYNLEVIGAFPHFQGYPKAKLLDVLQWGDIQWLSMNAMFKDWPGVGFSATDAPDLSLVSDMGEMFRNAANFNSNIGHWNTSSITKLIGTFREAFAFNGNIGLWDVSNVTSLDATFLFARNFNTDLSNWQVSKVISLANTFRGTKFNQNISTWDVSSVVSMEQTFRSSPFNQDISSWNVSKVTDLRSTFEDTPFNQNIGSWNVSSVTRMDKLFQNNLSFNQNIGAWDVSEVSSMVEMFNGALVFNQSIGAWDVSNVNNMQGMFRSTHAFNQNIGSWNVAKVTNMEDMFRGSFAFNQDISSWDVSAVTTMRQMLENADAFNQPIGKWNVSNNLSFREMFRQNNGFNQNLGAWILNPSANYLSVFGSATAFTCENWSNTIIGWEKNNPTLSNIPIGGPNAPFDTIAAQSRNLLLARGWTINGTAFDGLCVCPRDLVLNGTISSGIYSASGSISTNGLIDDGARVQFIAPAVNLEPSFKAPNGTVFSVEIRDGCPAVE